MRKYDELACAKCDLMQIGSIGGYILKEKRSETEDSLKLLRIKKCHRTVLIVVRAGCIEWIA